MSGDKSQLALIFKITLFTNRRESDSTIHGPGVEKREVQPLRTVSATVDFPVPAGPSIVITIGRAYLRIGKKSRK